MTEREGDTSMFRPNTGHAAVGCYMEHHSGTWGKKHANGNSPKLQHAVLLELVRRPEGVINTSVIQRFTGFQIHTFSVPWMAQLRNERFISARVKLTGSSMFKAALGSL